MKKTLSVRVDEELLEELEVLALVNGRSVSEELREQLAQTIKAAKADPYLPQRLMNAVAVETQRVQRLTKIACRLRPDTERILTTPPPVDAYSSQLGEPQGAEYVGEPLNGRVLT